MIQALKIKKPYELDVAIMSRGIAAIAVVWWHTKGAYLSTSWLSGFNVSGRFAVLLFFILSGYLMGVGFVEKRYRFDRKGLKKFYWNRFLRIYPLLFFVSILSICVLLWKGVTIDISLKPLMEQFLMVQWNHIHYTYVGVFWTLGVEIQFYLILPLLLYLQWQTSNQARASLSTFVFLLLINQVWFFYLPDNFVSNDRSLLVCLVHFQAGIFMSTLKPYFQEKALSFRSWQLVLIAGAALLLLYCSNFLYHTDIKQFQSWQGTLLTDLFGCLILVLHIVMETKSIRLNFFTEFLAILGVLSYGVYAWHAFVQMHFTSFTYSFSRVLILSILFAYLTYILIEKPILKLKK